jgi:hypothetical protein
VHFELESTSEGKKFTGRSCRNCLAFADPCETGDGGYKHITNRMLLGEIE